MSTTVSICPRFPVQGRCHAHAHLEPRNQAAVHIPPSPTNKWPDQAHEQDNQAVHLCVCGSSPSGLGSEPTFCNPCIQHIRASIDPDHPFPHAIRSRSSTATRPQSVLVNPQHADATEWWLYLQHHKSLLPHALQCNFVVTQQRQKQATGIRYLPV